MNSPSPEGSHLILPSALRSALIGHADRAAPAECCGLLIGRRDGTDWRVARAVESANASPDPERRFAIDLPLQFAVTRSLRPGPDRIIGCYHSHPAGPAQPSATDRAGMSEPDFLWLILGRSDAPPAPWDVRAFQVVQPGSAVPLPICSDPGAKV